jgi:hypothetical protein
MHREPFPSELPLLAEMAEKEAAQSQEARTYYKQKAEGRPLPPPEGESKAEVNNKFDGIARFFFLSCEVFFVCISCEVEQKSEGSAVEEGQSGGELIISMAD